MIIMNGKKIKEEIIGNIKEQILKQNITPHLVVIRVGNDEASKIYVKNKKNSCEEANIKFTELYYEENTTTETLISCIEKLNQDKTIHGILVQLPLPKHIDTNKVINTIDENKDVDGLTDINRGKSTNNKRSIIPCTPKGIMYLLDYYNINIEGKHAVIIGRSNLVGKPLIDCLLQRNATVTICHSKTNNLSNYTTSADILISAVGQKDLIKENMIKPHAVVIDVGISKQNGKIYGDVSNDVNTIPSYITKTPGGVGPMTVAMLLQNTLECYYKNISKLN